MVTEPGVEIIRVKSGVNMSIVEILSIVKVTGPYQWKLGLKNIDKIIWTSLDCHVMYTDEWMVWRDEMRKEREKTNISRSSITNYMASQQMIVPMIICKVVRMNDRMNEIREKNNSIHHAFGCLNEWVHEWDLLLWYMNERKS